jgi:hypothetical protein
MSIVLMCRWEEIKEEKRKKETRSGRGRRKRKKGKEKAYSKKLKREAGRIPAPSFWKLSLTTPTNRNFLSLNPGTACPLNLHLSLLPRGL